MAAGVRGARRGPRRQARSPRPGDAWDEFTSGFEAGFEAGCAGIFDWSPDGSLYAGDVEYVVDDCTDLASDPENMGADIPGGAPDSPEDEGHDAGVNFGCRTLFEEEGIDARYYGDTEVTADDCEGAPTGGIPPKPSSPVKTRCASVPDVVAVLAADRREASTRLRCCKRVRATRLVEKRVARR